MYHIIIIEDDPMVAAINRQYALALPAFSVDRVFKNGAEALEYLRENDADLIILDYYTPLMNGSQFIDRLHTLGKTPSVIMVTSANDSDIVRSLLSRGVFDYLVKPFTAERFHAALKRFSETRRYLDGQSAGLSQEALDTLLSRRNPDMSQKPPLTKGLSDATLAMIREYVRTNPESLFTSEQIAEQVQLSRVTIRRYMNYLTETGELVSVIDYKTGGRPSIKYGWKPLI
ncbi:MAG: response regulator [Lachnospiraceae bacterium]|nr:response regulator [Lachnospiraceae bacterium]